MLPCPVCTSLPEPAFTALVLRRHPVQFHHCRACGYLYSETPYWLDQAYSSAIASADVGLVMRNQMLATKLRVLLFHLFGNGGKFLDTAGGTGLLVRMLRDAGYDFRWEDPHCANALARGFEAAPDEAGFEAVTAMEVLEHLHSPLPFIEQQLARSRSRSLLFTTELFDGAPPARDWWYYAFEMGQHVGFFQHRTLATMAERLGVHFHSAGGLHLFTALNIAPSRYRRLARRPWRWQRWQAERTLRSLTQQDFARMIADADAASAAEQQAGQTP